MALLDWLKKQAKKSATSSKGQSNKKTTSSKKSSGTSSSRRTSSSSSSKSSSSSSSKSSSSSSAKKKAEEEARKRAEEEARRKAELEKKKKAAKKTQENLLKNTKATQEKQKKRGGVVLSDKTIARKQAAKKAQDNLKKTLENTKAVQAAKKTTNKDEVKKAIEKSQQRTALGTKKKRITETVKVDKEEGKKTKGHAKIRTYSYEQLSAEEANKMAVAAQQGRLDEMLKADKKLAKKVSELNVKDYAKSPAVMGALDQLTMGRSVSDNPVYNYSDTGNAIMKQQKQTKAYDVGRAVGAIAEFGLGGTGTLGSALANTAGKKALLEATKQGGKQLAKTTAKNMAKETAADTLVSAPLNILDAVKFSYEDGKIDKKKLLEEVVFNIGGDILIGGALSGLTHGLSAKQVLRFNKIDNKIKRGDNVSEAELKFHQKHLDDFTEKVETKIKQEAEQQATKPSGSVDNSVNNTPVNHESTISKTETVEQSAGDTTPLSQRDIDTAGKQNQKAYMYENPEVKPYFQEEATNILTDLQQNYIKGERNYSDKMWEETGNGFTGTTRRIDADVASLKDTYKWTYEDIERGLKAIIEDNGKENNAVSKRLEFLIDERLRNGHDDFLGGRIPANEEYLALLRDKEITSYSDEAFNQWAKSLYEGDEITKTVPTTSPLKAQVDEMRKGGATDDEILEQLEAQGVEPYRAMEAVDGADWEATAREAYENPTKTYNNTAEMLKDQNPTPEAIAQKGNRIDPKEVPQAKTTAVKLANQVDDDVAEIFEPWVREGHANRKVLQTQEECISMAEKELADGRLYDNFMESNVEDNEHLFMARAKVLLEDLMKKSPESNEASEQLINAMEKASDASSSAARLLNATKLLLRNTPDGRLRMFKKEAERLSNRFSDRIDGGKITLTPEQERRILRATDETIEEVAEEINKEIWENIPATWFEKWNEFRHTSMLFNARTHARNLLGNGVFYVGRLISDGLEIAAYKVPAVKKKLESKGGKVQMLHVTRKELSENKSVINKIFDENYKKSGSKGKYIENTRPDGVAVFRNKALEKLKNFNYAALEWEDMLAFKPEYRKNFIRWCKAHDVKLSDIPNMTKEQLQKADTYALQQAERATFRDNSAFASKIVGIKNKTATKKGKTAIGTAGYRVANVALESNLPFVKTPINILKRSVDYSPVGMIRSTVELATAKTADDFMQGVHHMATGLTGSGVFALGMWLANNDLIMLKAGEESGDAYYDRDMGYQDYSLILNINGKETSLTIDWVSPMQTSLFMGAAAHNNLTDDGFTLTDMFDGLLAATGSMLDMSFMSSTKDTVETFMEKVYRNGTGEDADWTGAVMKTLLGSVPQGYLNGFVPQIVSQTATALDSKQRDTRSTAEDPILSSWDSFGKKIANRIPVLRNLVLNPKLDRFGNDVETGQNVFTRFLNAYVNPSTVKTIKRTALDNEIIKIYNSLEDGSDEKKFYYYNFTGNPNYDLGNGKRMSYDEAYKYGKSKRIEQTKMLKDMIDSKSYKNMPMSMKADEVNDAHWIAQTFADRKTYGSKFALNRIKKGGSETDSRAAKLSKSIGVSAKAFVDFYLTKEKLIARSHDTDYNTKALAVALSGNDDMAILYDVNIDKVNVAKEYLKNGGSAKEYSNASCNIISTITKNDATISTSNKALAAANHKVNERTYTALGISEQKANMGVGLKNFGYTFDSLLSMKNQMKYGGFDVNQNGSISKSELTAYIDSLGLDSNEEKACIFAYFSTANNPYGNVPNYLGFKNVESTSSGGYSSGGSRSRGGGSSEPSAKKNNLPSWEDYIKDYISNIEDVAGVKFDKWDSPLDKTYQNKINSILKKMEVKQ